MCRPWDEILGDPLVVVWAGGQLGWEKERRVGAWKDLGVLSMRGAQEEAEARYLRVK